MLKKKPQSKWRTPRVVNKSDVAAHLYAIVRSVEENAKVVHVGTSLDKAYSVFVPKAEYLARKDALPVPAKDILVDDLRRRWAFEREQVENSGQPLRIRRKKIICGYLVPTDRALQTKVKSVRESIDHAHTHSLEAMGKRVDQLATVVSDLQTMVVKIWRREHGFDPTVVPALGKGAA